MTKTQRTAKIQNERGMASIELVPMLLLFVMLFSYTLGAFGVIHTGILNSIAARTYAFETFRNRNTLLYFRDTGTSKLHYQNVGSRLHAVGEKATPNSGDSLRPTERSIRMGLPLDPVGRTPAEHERVNGIAARNESVSVNPVWVKIKYGICFNPACGG